MGAIIYNVVGVMSGTSLDGVDLAIVRFEKTDSGWQFAFQATETIPYNELWKTRLAQGISLDAIGLERLNVEYTVHLAEIIGNFLHRHTELQVDWVCSHGHTILHRPADKVTLQIGNLPFLAELIQRSVVCDFRVQDVVLGGQGAPLVPIGDRLLFSDYTYCLNLGGFSNVSFEQNGQRVAFDLTPVNVVMNPIAESLGKPYDDQGNWARSGKLIPELFYQLNTLGFYQQVGPKSLGMEFVNEHIVPLLAEYKSEPHAVLHTWVEHIAFQMSKSFILPNARVLVTGGGAYNRYLLERLAFYTPTIEWIVPDADVLEFKEALIFGLLGVLRLEGIPNTLASVTGAIADHSAGSVFPYQSAK